jgi:hypothetical protein
LGQNRQRLRKLLPPGRLCALEKRLQGRKTPFQWLARLLLYGRRGRKKAPRTFRNQPLKGNIMNIHKHMEVIFVVALAVVGFGSMAIDSMPEADMPVSDASASASASAPVMRDVAAQGTKQDAAPVAVVCAPKAARRA